VAVVLAGMGVLPGVIGDRGRRRAVRGVNGEEAGSNPLLKRGRMP
jgi:hypothetical protein